VSSKQTTKKVGSNRNKPKQDLFRLCFGLFCETKNKKFRLVLVCFGLFQFVSVCFGVSNLYRNNQNKQNCFKTNRNNPKSSENYQNMLSIKLFRLFFCLFRFNRQNSLFCFGIDVRQPKLTVLKQTKTNRNNPKFSEKNSKIWSLSNCFCCSSVCFGLIETPKISVSV
jgi:hypothetical protein